MPLARRDWPSECRPGQVEFLAVQPDMAGAAGDAAEDGQKFRLPVARHAGDAENLTRADVEGHALQPLDLVGVHDAQVLDLQHHLAGFGRRLGDVEKHLPPDHHLGQFLGAGLGGLDRRHHLAPTHHADRIGDLHDFTELVGNQDDGLALLLQPIEDTE